MEVKEKKVQTEHYNFSFVHPNNTASKYIFKAKQD